MAVLLCCTRKGFRAVSTNFRTKRFCSRTFHIRATISWACSCPGISTNTSMGARTSEVEATVGPSVGRAAAGVIPGFRRDVCAILGYYAASGGKFLATFRDNPSVPTSGLMDS